MVAGRNRLRRGVVGVTLATAMVLTWIWSIEGSVNLKLASGHYGGVWGGAAIVGRYSFVPAHTGVVFVGGGFPTYWWPRWKVSGSHWVLVVPGWIPVALAVAGAAWALRREGPRPGARLFAARGYDLEGIPREAPCPECGGARDHPGVLHDRGPVMDGCVNGAKQVEPGMIGSRASGERRS